MTTWEEARKRTHLSCPWCGHSVARVKLRSHLAGHGLMLRTGPNWETKVMQEDLDQLKEAADGFQEARA